MFDIFTNDLFLCSKIQKSYNFADGNTISAMEKDINTLSLEKLSKEFEHAINWFQMNNMIAYPNKIPGDCPKKFRRNGGFTHLEKHEMMKNISFLQT